MPKEEPHWGNAVDLREKAIHYMTGVSEEPLKEPAERFGIPKGVTNTLLNVYDMKGNILGDAEVGSDGYLEAWFDYNDASIQFVRYLRGKDHEGHELRKRLVLNVIKPKGDLVTAKRKTAEGEVHSWETPEVRDLAVKAMEDIDLHSGPCTINVAVRYRTLLTLMRLVEKELKEWVDWGQSDWSHDEREEVADIIRFHSGLEKAADEAKERYHMNNRPWPFADYENGDFVLDEDWVKLKQHEED